MKIPNLIILAAIAPTLVWSQPVPQPPAQPAVLPGKSTTEPVIVIPAGHTMQGIPLATLLEEYSALVGRTLIPALNLPKVTFDFITKNNLTHKEAKAFYETLLSSRRIAVLPMGEKFVLAIPAAEVAKTPPSFTDASAKNLPEADSYVMVKVKLQHVMPSSLVGVLANFAKSPNSIMGVDHARILYLRDYSANVKRMLEIIEDLDVVKETHEAVIPTGGASAIAIADSLSPLTGRIRTGRLPSGLIYEGSVPGNTTSKLTTSGGSSSSSGRPSSSSRSSSIRNTSGLTRKPILAGTSIIACESINAVLVVAPTKSKLQLAKSIIEKLIAASSE